MDGRTTPTGLPRIVSNPVMGVTVEFVTAADESGGEQVEARVSIPAGDKGPPPHFHTGFEETFTALEGTLFMDLGDRRGITLQPGESAHVARNVRHRYYNAGDQTAVFRFTASPGRAYEMGIRAGFGLAADGRTDARGVPRNPLDLALITRLSGSYVSGVPLWLQEALTSAGVRLAQLFGRDPHFSKYTRGKIVLIP
jgi:quercetin dioxygenase-like cupin family protein